MEPITSTLNKSLSILQSQLLQRGIELPILPARSDWSAVHEEEQKLISQKLDAYLALTQGLDYHEFKGRFDRQHLKKFLKRSGLNIHDDNLDFLIEDSDVLEAYDVEGQQIFRNLEIFRYTSYSLTELVSYHWTELYERPAMINEIIFREWAKIVQTDTTLAIPLTIPKHLLKEKMNQNRQVLIELKYAWRMLDERGNYAGLLISQKASLVEVPTVGFI